MQTRTSVGSKSGLLGSIAKVISKVTNPFGELLTRSLVSQSLFEL